MNMTNLLESNHVRRGIMPLNKVAHNRLLISNMLDREGHHPQFSNVFKNAVTLDLLLTYKFQIKRFQKQIDWMPL